MNQREYFLWFLDRLPVLDLTWSDEIQTAWWRCYDVLWRWACRLIVEDAIEQFVAGAQAQPHAQPKQIGRYAVGSRVKIVVADDTFTGRRATVRSAKRRNSPRRILYFLDVDDAPLPYGAGPYEEDDIVLVKEPAE